MKICILCTGLILVILCNGAATKELFNIRNAKFWEKDIPKSEFKELISLQLVRKEWVPKGSSVSAEDKILPRFSGSVQEAFELFLKESDYKFDERPLNQAFELLTVENGYRPELDSIFIIHTISGDANSYYVKNIVAALALRNMVKRYNVFALNMPGLQDSMEKAIIKSLVGVKANYAPLSEAIGEFVVSAIQKGLMNHDKIHFIGFCYSSQLAGYVARYISSKTNDRKIKSITALDPFSVGLYAARNIVLSRSDAQLVYAYHTNSATFGSLYRWSTADFIFNSGLTQPGCSLIKNYMCSHRRAATAFWYILLYPDLWLARKCSNWLLFSTCLCSRKEKVPLTFPPTPGAKGRYYLRTGSSKPYGLGPSGANCSSRAGRKGTEKIEENTAENS